LKKKEATTMEEPVTRHQIQVVFGLAALAAARMAAAVPPPPATSLNTCQNAVKTATATFIKNKVTAIGTCLQAVSTQMVKNNAADASAAGSVCVTQFRKLYDSRGLHKQLSDKLVTAISAKCTPGGSNTHTLADIIGVGAGVPQPLDADNLGGWCSHYGGSGSIASVQDWINCITAAAECDVASAIASQYPRVLDWLNLAQPAMSAVAPGADASKVTDAVAALTTLKTELDPNDANVVSIQCGGIGSSGTATAADVLIGKTFSNSSAGGLIGTMPNNGAVTLTPGTSDQTIAAGYHNGSGKCAGDADLVSGNIRSGVNLFGVNGDSNVVNTSSGDAAAGDLLSGKIVWVDGAQVTGAMANNGAVTLTPGTADQTIAAGYHNGSGKVIGDADLLSGNIKSGVNLFGVNGSPSVVETSSATATAADMLSGKTAYVNGSLVTGSVPSGSDVNGANGAKTVTIPDGLYAGSKTATANDTNLVAGNIKSGTSLFGVSGSVIQASGNAAAGDVLASKTFSNASGADTGSMPNNGAVNITPGTSAQTIAAGYHNGAGSVAGDANLVPGNIKSGATIFGVGGSVIQASGNAGAGDVLTGKTFSNAGGSGTGTMPNNGAVTLTPGTSDQAIAAGYHNGSGKCAGDANLISGNIKSGATIFGVSGNSNVVNTGGATAGAGDMLSGKTAYANGSLLTGTVPAGGNVTGSNGSLSMTIPDALYSGSKTATAADSNLAPGNIRSGTAIFGVSGSVIQASGNAGAGDVLTGKTFSNASGAGSGTMPDNGAVSITPGTAAQTIPAGYHNGAGSVAGDTDLVSGNIKSGVNLFGVNGSSSVVDTASATATATDMASGKTAYVNGSLVTGTVAAGANVSGGNGLKTFTIPDGIYSGSKTATANDSNLTAANISNGVTILGVTGTVLPAQPLRTGQAQCDQGSGTLGACPGSPAGQDGYLLKGATRSYTVNANGTVTDNKTGLIWEKLDDNNANGIHDYSATFTWYNAFKKIQVLNGNVAGCIAANNPDACCTGAGTGSCTAFAGQTDWRLPDQFELHSLTDLGRYNPSIDPVFDTSCAGGCTAATCSCTQSSYYWSSTTWQGGSSEGWAVYFYGGSVGSYGKSNGGYVRAVRGGS
jgi:hypothetical protein